jgi:hypothetical protein
LISHSREAPRVGLGQVLEAAKNRKQLETAAEWQAASIAEHHGPRDRLGGQVDVDDGSLVVFPGHDVMIAATAQPRVGSGP